MTTFDLDRRSLAVLDKILADMTTADLGRPTPCTGWTLTELLRHQVSENHGFAIAARDGSAPNWDSAQLGNNPYGAYTTSVDAYLEAFAGNEVLERQLTIGKHGTFPGQIALAMHLVDTIAHGWDLAKTLNVPYEPDTEAVQMALKFAQQIPTSPTDRLNQKTFAPVVKVPKNAPELHHLLGLLGRSPTWTP
ncbi:TIGR03086 family metal-binding protein [Amycolatopsis sp. H20-H5]|uniref:TIGR03086 family metal-binding protein n=1 Tax=Amycolatopsis sp. H20-H5 TaxID=3046309 RepID=UPI002DB57765|nr:TIGR03086 family metal-binding protein [Amycolatopsis sp. H20-H5]MEC3973977.1 TIGR03086 family metal-binding protein [Amycolatopsis sp. H20-H5]